MSILKLTWDDLRERARNHNDLTADQKRDAVLAFDELQRIFGDALFNIELGHPLFFFFFDRSGWRCEWAIWFARFLQSLEKHSDFPSLVRDLKNADRYSERMSVLKIVEILQPAGFIFSFDSPINSKDGEKNPDLFIKLDATDPGFYIEVSTLGPHQKQREADEVFHAVTSCLLGFHGEYSGSLERVLAPAHLQEVLQRIQDAAQKASNETGFERLEIPGVVQIAFAIKNRIPTLQTWAKARGMKPGEFSGPDVHVEEFDRISFKLEKKIKQVPLDRSNVIVIYSHLFAMPPSNTDAFEAFVRSLEDVVYKHAHIGYLVLIFRWTGGNANQVIHIRDHICINRCQLYFNCDSMMLFKNRFAAKPMSQDIEDKFLKAFKQAGEVR